VALLIFTEDFAGVEHLWNRRL